MKLKWIDLKLILTLAIMVVTVAIPVSAEGQKEKDDVINETQQIVNEILSEYNSETLTKENVLVIHEKFREEEIKGGPELDKMIEIAGFDAMAISNLDPPPQEDQDRNDNNSRSKEDKKDKNSIKKDSGGVIFKTLEMEPIESDFTLSSSAVVNGELLDKYKGETKINNKEKSIPLNWKNIPEDTESLAIIMYHYPHAEDHSNINSYLLLWNIDPSINEISYGEADKGEWFMGSNKDGNAISYTSPNSPSAGVHEYTIAIFSLAEKIKGLPEYSTLEVGLNEFMTALEDTAIISKAELNFKDVNK